MFCLPLSVSSAFVCSTCDQKFLRLAHLRQHEVRHTPGTELLTERKTFVCEVCSPEGQASPSSGKRVVAFTTKRNLITHMRTAHSSVVNKFPCTHVSCPAILSSKVGLENRFFEKLMVATYPASSFFTFFVAKVGSPPGEACEAAVGAGEGDPTRHLLPNPNAPPGTPEEEAEMCTPA